MNTVILNYNEIKLNSWTELVAMLYAQGCDVDHVHFGTNDDRGVLHINFSGWKEVDGKLIPSEVNTSSENMNESIGESLAPYLNGAEVTNVRADAWHDHSY